MIGIHRINENHYKYSDLQESGVGRLSVSVGVEFQFAGNYVGAIITVISLGVLNIVYMYP